MLYERKELKSLTEYPCKEWAKIVNHLWQNGSSEQPYFTSIAFPYSGYYVMRDGWKNDSLFLWMISARAGRGHHTGNINSISIIGYGRHLIIDSGASSYGNKKFVNEDQWDIIKGIDEYRETFGHNSIVVDGKGQRMVLLEDKDIKPYNETIQARWLTSDVFDFTEGFYNDGYGNTKEENITVMHHRQLIFVKEVKCWIVIDKMIADKPHKYTQTWNFQAPDFEWDDWENHIWQTVGYKESDVNVDEENNIIFTSDYRGGNIFIYNFSDQNVSYNKYYGNKDPYFGWMSPRVVCKRIPKVDVHASIEGQKGETILVTAIVPTENINSNINEINNISSDGKYGFSTVFENGTKLTHISNKLKEEIKIGRITAIAESLTLAEDTNGNIRGMVLSCESMSVDQENCNDNCTNFEFLINAGGFKMTNEITIPSTMKWVEEENGLKVKYRDEVCSIG